MMEQAKLNPNAKLAEAMRKKTGEGYVVENAKVQGSLGTIPAGAVVPVKLTNYVSSQSSQPGEIYTAQAPETTLQKKNLSLYIKVQTLKDNFWT